MGLQVLSMVMDKSGGLGTKGMEFRFVNHGEDHMVGEYDKIMEYGFKMV